MTVALDDRADIERVFQAQRANRPALKRSTAAERIARLQRLRDEVVLRAADIDAALHRDLRRMLMGTANIETTAVLDEIDAAAAGLPSWMEPETIEPSAQFAGNSTYIMYEPRGVVLLLGPWNFPFALTLAPLVQIVAAGNAAIVKPNEMQPNVAAVIGQIIASVFEKNEVVCFEGGIPLAEALQELPFDHVFFTGSPAVGRRVMAAAARHLTSVTLELGGKCPAILDDTCDLIDAAGKIVAARFANAGQLCLSVDHVWVPQARVAELLQALCGVIEAMFYTEGVLQRERLPRMVDARNFARVKHYVDDAVAGGARIVRGGEMDAADLTIYPTVLTDVRMDSRAMQEEIFGPVLPVIGYDNVQQAIAQIDITGKPLAVYIFSQDQAFIDDVLNETSSGGVTVNDVLMHAMESRLPFGGVNGSGMGRCKGVHGFRELSNAR